MFAVGDLSGSCSSNPIIQARSIASRGSFRPNLTAITYVVPADRFEIERSSAIVVGRVLRSHVERVPESGLETVTDVALKRRSRESRILRAESMCRAV